MAENLGAREQSIGALEPTAGALARTVRSVRRRRAVRHSSQAVGAVAIAAVVALGSWFGLRGTDDPVPVVAPTPTSSTPAPSASATPAATVVPDDILGLPPTLPMPPGLLQKTKPGWVLAIYASEPYSDGSTTGGDSIPAVVAHTVVLAAPTGELYRVGDLPTAMGVRLLTWTAGSTTAVVSIDWQGDLGQGTVPRAELDLTTGSITPRPVVGTGFGDQADWYFDGVAADGNELWSNPTSTDAVTSDLFSVAHDGTARPLADLGYTMLLDPTGRRAVTPPHDGTSGTTLGVVDLVAGRRTEHAFEVPGKSCDVVGWLDTDALLALCLDANYDRWPTAPSDLTEAEEWASADPSMFRFDIGRGAGSLLARLTQSDPLPRTWSGTWLRQGEVAYTGSAAQLHQPAGCATSVYVWKGSSSMPLQSPDGPDADTFGSFVSGDRLLVNARVGCDGPLQPPIVVAHSISGGASTVLLPAPPATAEVPEWMSGVGSWVVGR